MPTEPALVYAAVRALAGNGHTSAAVPERARRDPGGRLRWYAARLRAMSPVEVGARGVEQAKRAISRWHLPDLERLAGAGDALPTLPALDAAVARVEQMSGYRARLRRLAEDWQAGRVRCLGRSWSLPEDPRLRWHLDPSSGRVWPATIYCFDVDYRHASGHGDVKYVWELNRLQHLQALALQVALEGDEELRDACAAEIDTWIAANPLAKGVAWASGIELALRAVSLMVAVSLLGPDSFAPAQRRRLRACLAAHAWWIRRFPSRFSSANNHLVAEAGALFLLGATLPDLPGGKRYLAEGAAVLAREAERQIHGDGIGAEQSPTYTALTLEWLLLCAVTGRAIGRDLPPPVWDRIERAAEALRWFIDSAGNLPRIGDDDECRVLHGAGSSKDHVASVVAAAAAALDRADLDPPPHEPGLLAALIPGRRSVAPAAGPSGIRHFPEGGYTVVRQNGDADLLLVMDHGPLGHLALSAHGHADTLALWLHRGGAPILVDGGTYLYHGAEDDGVDWRAHFRGTAAHSALLVDGCDSSRPAGPFSWWTRARSRVSEMDDAAADWRIEAEHDGYGRRHGVRHRRRVARGPDGLILLTDVLTGRGRRRLPVEIGFLFHPSIEVVALAAGTVTASRAGEAVLEIRHPGMLAARVERGRLSPPRGWYSGAFGDRRPACRLALAGALEVGAPHVVELGPTRVPGASR